MSNVQLSSVIFIQEPAQGFKTIVKGSKKTRIFSQEGQAVGTQRMLMFRKTRKICQKVQEQSKDQLSRSVSNTGHRQDIQHCSKSRDRNLIDRNQKPEELGSQVKNLTVRSQEYLTVRSQEGKNYPSVKEVLPRRSAAMKMVAIHILQSQQSQRTPTGVKDQDKQRDKGTTQRRMRCHRRGSTSGMVYNYFPIMSIWKSSSFYPPSVASLAPSYYASDTTHRDTVTNSPKQAHYGTPTTLIQTTANVVSASPSPKHSLDAATHRKRM
ncbi:hypothetical protein CRE_06852 [Caenorhabditis remanei]|uniref:Uncharacterized protein n=1 Tax=Caenorhabditis remanei TaxID=31234 RepID=E3MZL4_CAERE|nr:hypothetical protein CRE_06852 [Caenorhabditis remanei]